MKFYLRKKEILINFASTLERSSEVITKTFYSSTKTFNTGTTVLDSFLDSSFNGVYYLYSVYKDNNKRVGTITLSIDKDLDEVRFQEISTMDIGSTSDVQFNFEIINNYVKFNVISLSDNWIIKFERSSI